MQEKEVKEKIKDKLAKEREKCKKRTILISTLIWVVLTFISTYKHPRAFTPFWILLMAMLAVAILVMGCFFGAFVCRVVELDIVDKEQALFVRSKLSEGKKVEVRKKSAKHNQLIYELQKRGKFFATFLDEKEKQVLIIYRFDGEEKEISYESMYPSEVFEKYTFEEED